MAVFFYHPVVVVLTLMMLGQADGHGYLFEPPSRSSMWRAGFNTPKNYDDNALFCGGFSTQYGTNHGKCGVCGDPWNEPPPRANEAGGRYGNGIITRTYAPGEEINVRVVITANHKGWFEFRLCDHNDPSTPITHECLDKHLLELADGSGTRYQLGTRTGYVDLKLKLPPGLTCTQCVLQWKWHAGNSYGVDHDTGRGCVGCGDQEEFYGCSDIAIGGSAQTASTIPSPTPSPPNPGTACRAIGSWQGNAALDSYCRSVCPGTGCPLQYCSCSSLVTTSPPTTTTTTTTTTTPVIPISVDKCRAISSWSGSPDLDRYCNSVCPGTNCPTQYCACGTSNVAQSLPTTTTTRTPISPVPNGLCRGINSWSGSPDLDRYCNLICPGTNCPTQNCACGTSNLATSAQPRPSLTPSTRPPTTTTTPAVRNGSCRGVGSWSGFPDLDRYCNLVCPGPNCPTQNCACGPTSNPTTTARPTHPPIPPPTTTTTPPPTTTTTPAPVNPLCHGINTWQGNADLDRYCAEQCPLGNCPVQFCSCSTSTAAALPALVTTTPRPTTTPPKPTTTLPITSPAPPRCYGINSWQGDPMLDKWCEDNCAVGLCPAQNCQCTGSSSTLMSALTTPTTNPPASTTSSSSTVPPPQCHAVGAWAGQVVLDQWCTETCAQFSCDPQYCSCTKCYAVNGWAGVPELDRYCDEKCRTGNCPPQYCACPSSPGNPTAQPASTTRPPTPPPTTTTTTTPPTTAAGSNCHAINNWQGVAELDRWCRETCATGNCPPVYCSCAP